MPFPFFVFGQVKPEYAVPVLNERAVRAGAGILFFFAMVAFMNAWLSGNFAPTRVFVLAFLFDFVVRLFINPAYAPSLVIGQWLVRHQQPEWTGAPQKRFAWAIGLVLALTMWVLVVVKGVVGPVNLLVCAVCLMLLFFESAFGICIGCRVYNRFNAEQARLCPGGACEYVPPTTERLGGGHVVPLVLLAMLVAVVVSHEMARAVPAALPAAKASDQPAAQDPAEVERCKVPDFAKAMGHEAKWKLHNNCP
ncbi:DUF4395 domain-containing protein [Limnohabitans lacus]|uniref:DUF4395 domain-containing protein n=1 Tax=Limnohabitans lacus TaxID=3045173 RepID=A0ABT6X7L7_9BURK|nr:DUF4395 domain-containing protein [Limnohabitans sp. HM2-2]MDI9234115.1 DUF4395 domain-containing protein [Limnohabitans sp. HM2-2]